MNCTGFDPDNVKKKFLDFKSSVSDYINLDLDHHELEGFQDEFDVCLKYSEVLSDAIFVPTKLTYLLPAYPAYFGDSVHKCWYRAGEEDGCKVEVKN